MAIRRKSLPPDHPDIALSLNNLGLVQYALRDYAAAKQSDEEALAIFRKALPKDHPDIAGQSEQPGDGAVCVARLCGGEAEPRGGAGDPPQGPCLKDHPDIAGSLNNLGPVQYALRDYAGAKQSHEQALAIRRKSLPPDHPDIADSLNNLGMVQYELREYARGKQSHQQALAIRRKSLPKDHPDIAGSLDRPRERAVRIAGVCRREWGTTRRPWRSSARLRPKD